MHVVVLDINDNAPVFSKPMYEASVSEDRDVDYSVITISATDADQPGTPNSQIFYTFEGGDDGDGSFHIEHSGGRLRLSICHTLCCLRSARAIDAKMKRRSV